jgi:hypothetical protein
VHVAAEAAPRCAFLSTREFQRRISLLGNVLVDCQRSLVLLGVLMYQEYEVRGPSRRAISVTGHLKFKGCSDFYVLSKFSFYLKQSKASAESFFNRLLKLCFNAQLPKGNAPKV